MNIQTTQVRSEGPSDYSSIAAVNYEAYLAWHVDSPYVSEPLLVDLLRHISLFDPSLSLVAETDGHIVGHALFSPFEFSVLGSRLSGVLLAPIAVKTDYQRQGIGKMLIEEGHRRAANKGHAFSLLCGHPSYYPRFGYRTEMFSLAGVKISVDVQGFNGEAYSERPVNGQDIPWLQGLWWSLHGDTDLALFPGTSICDWSNHSRTSRCIVVSKGNSVLGYARYAAGEPVNVKVMLASREDIPDLLAYLSWRTFGKAQGEVKAAIPYEMASCAVAASGCFEVVDKRAARDPFMIKVLAEDSRAAQYAEGVAQGLVEPGIIAWPPVFDLTE